MCMHSMEFGQDVNAFHCCGCFLLQSIRRRANARWLFYGISSAIIFGNVWSCERRPIKYWVFWICTSLYAMLGSKYCRLSALLPSARGNLYMALQAIYRRSTKCLWSCHQHNIPLVDPASVRSHPNPLWNPMVLHRLETHLARYAVFCHFFAYGLVWKYDYLKSQCWSSFPLWRVP